MNATVIRKTDKKTFDGKDLHILIINGKQGYYYADGDNMVEYDENIENITYTYLEKKEEDGVFITHIAHRTETRKILKRISDNRILGFHEYKDKEGVQLKAIVVWVYSRGKWCLSLKKGIPNLTNSDINVMCNTINEIGW